MLVSWMAFQRLVDRIARIHSARPASEPGLKRPPHRVTPFETRENYSEKLYRPDGFRRSYRWKRCRRDAWRRLVLTRVSCPECRSAHRHDGRAGIAVRPLLDEEMIERHVAAFNAPRG